MITLKVKKQMIIFLLTDKPQGVLEKNNGTVISVPLLYYKLKKTIKCCIIQADNSVLLLK